MDYHTNLHLQVVIHLSVQFTASISTVPAGATVYANVLPNTTQLQIDNYIAPNSANTTGWSAAGQFGVTISYYCWLIFSLPGMALNYNH